MGDNTWKLPGIGSYVAQALEQRDISAVFYAIVAMLVVILAYDQLLFRPLVAWSAKFRFEVTAQVECRRPLDAEAAAPHPTALRPGVLALEPAAFNAATGLRLAPRRRAVGRAALVPSRLWDAVFWSACWPWWWRWRCGRSSPTSPTFLSWGDLGEALLGGLYTMVRVVVLMALATALWVPIGVWLGLRPKWARRAQPVAQFLAAFPANLFFPIFVVAIVHWHLNQSTSG